MAVYYKWIKGCQQGATLNEGQWSYITWGKTGSIETDAMPQLEMSSGRDGVKTSFGYFLTSDMPTPEIKNNWNFKSGITLRWNETKESRTFYFYDKDETTKAGIYIDNGYLNIYNYPLKILNETAATNNVPALHIMGGVKVQKDFKIPEVIEINKENGLKLSVKAIIEKDLEIQGSTGVTVTKGNVTVESGYCEANFFNATSDKRSKENISPATYNAVELIKKLPVYNYNYKNNNEKVTGIMAQDLLQYQPDGLDLVSNKNATGENNDYMSIKNDKLMYVLLKAIQEQQLIIEELKNKIACLEDKAYDIDNHNLV